MSSATLPEGWVQILDEMHRRLDHAVALADARMTELPHVEPSPSIEERRQEIAQWNDRLRRLGSYLESAEHVVQGVDAMLQVEESHLKAQIKASETLRQRLSKETSRAIG
jgi:hypothetical protein